MAQSLIVARSIGELRRAAADGHAYYICERFEDAYGRLIVGIGAEYRHACGGASQWLDESLRCGMREDCTACFG